MIVRDIPRPQWPAFFDQFSRTHLGWRATIDEGESHPAGKYTHPLRSVTPFVSNNRVVHIDIRFQDDGRPREPVRITAPGTVRVDETTEGVAQALEIIDSKGVATRIRFSAAPGADRLDGIAPGELST